MKHQKSFDIYFEILLKFKRVFLKGGIKRQKYSIPALCFALFRLSNEMNNGPSGFGYEMEDQKEYEEDEMPVKLQKADHNKLFKLVHELVQTI